MQPIGGLISGLDTQSIIDALLGSYKQRIDKLEADEALLGLKREAFTDLSAKLYSLSDAAMQLRLASTLLNKSASSSNEAQVSAEVTAEAELGSHQVTVSQLAQAARATSSVAEVYMKATSANTLQLAAADGTSAIEGELEISGTSGKAAVLLGRIGGLSETTSLQALGVSQFSNLQISTSEGSFTLQGLDSDSTVGDFLEEVNSQGRDYGVFARLQQGHLVLTVAKGNEEIAISDAAGSDTLASKLFGVSQTAAGTATLIGARAVQASDTLGGLGVATTSGLTVTIEGVEHTLSLTSSSTVQDLVDALDGISGLQAELVDSHVVLSSELSGVDFEVSDSDYSTGIAPIVLGLQGKQDTHSPALEDVLVVGARTGAGLIGAVTGLSSDATLASLGVSSTSGFTLQSEGGRAYTFELQANDTVQNLLEAINATDTFSAQLTPDGRVEILAVDGGRHFTVSDSSYSGTVASELLGLSQAQSTQAPGQAGVTVTAAEQGEAGKCVSLRSGLSASDTLSSLGVTTTDGFTVTVGNSSVTLDLSGYSTPTVGNLVEALNSQVTGIRAELQAGRVVVTAKQGGEDIELSDSDYSGGIAPKLFGLDSAAWSVARLASAREDLTASTTLASLGVTTTDDLTFSVRGTSYSLSGLSTSSTVQDFVDAVNSQVTGVSARLVDPEGDGQSLLVLEADRVHEQFAVSTTGDSGGLGRNLLGLRTGASTLLGSEDNVLVVAGSTGAAVLGSVELQATDTLASYGVGDTSGFKVILDGAEYSLSGITSSSTVEDLVEALDALPGLSASLVQGKLELRADDTRQRLQVEDEGYSNTIAGAILGLTAAADTSSEQAGDVLVSVATTGDVTLAATYQSDVYKGTLAGVESVKEGATASRAISGVTLQGYGRDGLFNTGSAEVTASAELNASLETGASLVGGTLALDASDNFSTTTAASGNSGTQSDWTAAISNQAKAGSYYVEYDSSGNYAVFNSDGVQQGAWVASGQRFQANTDSDLAGSSFVHQASGTAEGDRWDFQVKMDTSSALSNLKLAEGASTSTNGFFSINGKRIYIDDYTTTTLGEVLARINGSGAGVKATYDAEHNRVELQAEPGGSIQLGSTQDTSDWLTVFKVAQTAGGTLTPGWTATKVDTSKPLAQAGLTEEVTSGTFTLNGVTLYVDPSTDSLEDVLERINTSSAGVKASYDSSSDKLVLVSKGDGLAEGQRISVGSEWDTSNFLAAMRLVTSGGEESQEIGSAAEWAQFTVDGTTYQRSSNEIDDVLQGVTLTLKSVTSAPVTLQISSDTDKALDALVDFIAAYNTVVDTATPPALTDEDKAYLEPLSDAERESMTPSEIDDYEKRYKEVQQQEALRKAGFPARLVHELRNTLGGTVEGLSDKYDSLQDLGLQFVAWSNQGGPGRGHLVVESTDKDTIKAALQGNSKLMQALREHPDWVQDLLAQVGYDGSGSRVEGTRELTDGVLTLPASGGALSFSVGDGTGPVAHISIPAGHAYTESELLQIFDAAGLNIGEDDEHPDLVQVEASFSNHKLVFQALSGASSIYLTPESQGSNGLESAFGISVEATSPGLVRLVDTVLKTYNGVGGILQRQVLPGGDLDRERELFETQRTSLVDRMQRETDSLWRKFAAMESALAKLQSQSNFLTQQLTRLPAIRG